MQENRIQLSSDNIRKIFGRLHTKSLAKKHGATQRKERKFSSVDLILSLWQLISIGEFSYDKWALQIGMLTNQKISGQAVWKRVGPPMLNVMKQLLEKSLKQRFDTLIKSSVFKYFPNVYIQDATHFPLPKWLSSAFPGSYSRSGESATAKVQAIFNLKKGAFSDFQLNSFRDNDQKDAERIVDQINKNDLVIRDLGYFTIESFKKIALKGAYYLSRYKFGLNIYDRKSEKNLNLLKGLTKLGNIDMDVEIGQKQRLTCRIIAVRVPEKVANQRRRKAKKDRHKSANHSKEYYKLLGYTIYVTNVTKDIWSDIEMVETAYRSRWYIEILFKGWKSNLKIKMDISRQYIDKQRAELLYYASLLMVCTLVMPVFISAQKQVFKENQFISILKTCAFINQQIEAFIQSKRLDKLLEQIQYFCTYESRNDRNNAIENMYKLAS